MRSGTALRARRCPAPGRGGRGRGAAGAVLAADDDGMLSGLSQVTLISVSGVQASGAYEDVCEKT